MIELGDYLRFLVALVFVLGLIGLFAFALRRAGALTMTGARGSHRRLAVQEILPLEGRRRLMLIRRDDREHLILIGQQGDIVVESDIDAAEARETSNRLREEAAAANDARSDQPASGLFGSLVRSISNGGRK